MEIIERYHRNPEQILNMFVDMQFDSPDGYIDQETARLVARELGLTETHVFELLSFYAILKTEPQARYVIKYCDSTPCHFSGASLVRQALREALGVEDHEVTEDGLFMYHSVPCVGACDHGPVIKIKDQVFYDMDREKIARLVCDLRDGAYATL